MVTRRDDLTRSKRSSFSRQPSTPIPAWSMSDRSCLRPMLERSSEVYVGVSESTTSICSASLNRHIGR